jgi:anti-anti-sigma factor
MNITRTNKTVIVSLQYQFTPENSKELVGIVEQEAANEGSTVVLDAVDLNFIDSRGIGSLVACVKKLQKKKGSLRMRNLNGAPLELFQDTGLNKIIPLEGSEAAAAEDEETADTSELHMKLDYETTGEVGIFHFSGILNSEAAIYKFKEQAIMAMASKRKILINFSDITYFDTALAAREICNICKLLKTSNGEIRLSNTKNLLENVLELTDDKLAISSFSTPDEALKNW